MQSSSDGDYSRSHESPLHQHSATMWPSAVERSTEIVSSLWRSIDQRSQHVKSFALFDLWWEQIGSATIEAVSEYWIIANKMN